MIKCISYWSLRDGLDNQVPIADALQAASDAGFEGLELSIAEHGVLTTGSSRDDCLRIRDLIQASPMVVQTLATGLSWQYNPASDDPATRERSLQLHAAALERAGWLGCEAMLYIPGVVKSPICSELVRYDRAVDRARAGVAYLLEVAQEAGVDLCIENVWSGLFYSPLELNAFVDSFDHERLGVYLDIGNLIGYQQHPPHWIELLGQRIKRVHIKDFAENFGWQGGYSFCDLGAGSVPWPDTVEALRRVGYDGTLVAEMLPHDPQLLARTAAAMQAIFR